MSYGVGTILLAGDGDVAAPQHAGGTPSPSDPASKKIRLRRKNDEFWMERDFLKGMGRPVRKGVVRVA